MNADDVRTLLRTSLAEGGLHTDASPDAPAIRRRVRSARRRRVATGALAGVASAALIGLVVWQAGDWGTDPAPPQTPTETSTDSTDPTTDPSATPSTDSSTPSDGGDPADWSEAVFPSCGDTFALPDRTSALVVDDGPSEPLAPAGGWVTTFTNTGTATISGDVAVAQTVVLDADGTVVATVDPDSDFFWFSEGSLTTAIGGGESLTTEVRQSPACTGRELLAGDYEVFVLMTVGEMGTTDRAELEQAQGGPFPMTIDPDVASTPFTLPAPEGAVPWTLTCGDAWQPPEPQTGAQLRLDDPIRTQRYAGDDIDGAASLILDSAVSGTLMVDVVLIQDGVIVSGGVLGGDAAPDIVAGAGTTIDTTIHSYLQDCNGGSLPAGDYQAVALALLSRYDDDVDAYAFDVVTLTSPVDVTLQ